MQVLPFIFLGSLFCMLAVLGDFIKPWPNFWDPFQYTMGMISLIISFLIPFNLMEKKKLRKSRINAGATSLVIFLMVLKPVWTDSGLAFNADGFGAGGMFVAIIVGIIVGLVMSAFGKFSFFKEESVIPDFVRAWFDSMLPIGILIVAFWGVIMIADVNLYSIIIAIFQPLAGIIETPWGFAIMMFLFTFLYSMGISSWVLTPVFTPVLLAAIAANVAGTGNNLVTGTTIYSSYLWWGGIGCTFPLVFMLMMSKSKKLKALGIASFPASVFNINEPVVFGAIVWNPILMIPFWIIGIVLPLITWTFTKIIAFAPIPKVLFEMWYTPMPIATWLTTGGTITGVLLFVINVAAATAIWFPFFKVYEKQELEAEKA
jgi:PTS system cellobiose-specific IIC component